LRNFLDKPKSHDEKKKTIKTRAASESGPEKRPELPPPIVFDSKHTLGAGNLAYFNSSNRDESIQQVSMRRKSWTRDKKIAANMYNARLRLKCYTEDRQRKPVIKKKPPPAQPLVIPPAYAQLFIREYGSNYSTLEEASLDYHRKRSASRESTRRNSDVSDTRLGSKSACETRPSSRRIPKKVTYEDDETDEDDDDDESYSVQAKPTTRSFSNVRDQHERNKITSQKIRAALFD